MRTKAPTLTAERMPHVDVKVLGLHRRAVLSHILDKQH